MQTVRPNDKASASGMVAVVGGSASGFYTAWLLARSGRRVRVFERESALAPVARTLIVTSRMRELLGPLGEPSVVNEIRRFELFTDGRAAQIPLERPDLVIERARLIRSLAEHAGGAGAELSLGRKFVGLESRSGGVALHFECAPDGRRESLEVSTVVGADGAASGVAESAGWPQLPTVPLVQAIVPLPKDMRPDAVRVWFIPEDTPYFYWLIPESDGRGALGLIGEQAAVTRRHLERFLDRRGFTPQEFQGARIPVYTRWTPAQRAVGGGRVFLVGDAAGQVKVSTVGGIVTGFRGAQGAAEAILDGGRSRALADLRRELDLHLLIRRAMHRFTQADYSRLVDLLNDSARRSLSSTTRDEAMKLLWNVCTSQPRLLLIALRGLLTRASLVRSS